MIASHLDDALGADINKITFDDVVPLEGQAKGLVSLVSKAKAENNGILSLGQIQELRRRALEIGRNAKGDLTASGQMARDTSSAVEKHLRDIVDSNAAAGVLKPETVTAWEKARDLTNLKFIT